MLWKYRKPNNFSLLTKKFETIKIVEGLNVKKNRIINISKKVKESPEASWKV